MTKAEKRVVAAKEALCFRMAGPSRSTVWKRYLRWRQAQNPPIPVRCDNPACRFRTDSLVWNPKPLKPILDHKEGNNSDNRPEMPQLLFANCDSRLLTRDGVSSWRIAKSEGGFAKLGRDGNRSNVLPAGRGKCMLTGGEVILTVRPPSPPGVLLSRPGEIEMGWSPLNAARPEKAHKRKRAWTWMAPFVCLNVGAVSVAWVRPCLTDCAGEAI